MKRIILLLAVVTFGVCVPRTQAAELTVDLFYDQLAPYGDWIDTGEYGYAWHPRDVGQDWRPYADGRWAYTDAGWTWVSDEPYSWAVYHYGRWANLSDVGWSWVPGREWGPAWVSFRRSDHYVGWAPLPPEASFGRDVQTISSWSDSYYDVGPTQYTFVEVRNFGAPRLREFIAPERDNIRIIGETRNITNIRVENSVVFNGGPEYDVISRESAQPIQRLRLDRRTDVVVTDRTAFRSSVQGDSLRVAAPLIQSSSREVAPAKVSRRLEKVEVNHGWRNAGDPAATQKLRTKMQAEAQVPAGLPPKPTFQKASATAAGGASTRGEQPANTPKATAETGAPTAPKSSGTATENPNPNARSKSQGVTTDPNSPPAGTAAEKNSTPAPTAGTAKGKKGQRGAAATPEATAKSNPNEAPTAATTEKGAAPESTPAKGKKGQQRDPATTAAQPDAAAATPAASKKKGGHNENAPAATPSRNAPPESATGPSDKPAMTKPRSAETAADPSNTPGGPGPEAKPQHKQPNVPAEGNTRTKPETGDRQPLGADANPKDRGPARKMESAPEAPKSHQPNAEPQGSPAKDGAPAAKGKGKGDKKDAPKDDKKPDEAPK